MTGRPTYRILLRITCEATQPPDRVILDLRRLLKALLRSFGFKCLDVVQVPFTRKGESQATEEAPKGAATS
jgi:hypothetical protein